MAPHLDEQANLKQSKPNVKPRKTITDLITVPTINDIVSSKVVISSVKRKFKSCSVQDLSWLEFLLTIFCKIYETTDILIIPKKRLKFLNNRLYSIKKLMHNISNP